MNKKTIIVIVAVVICLLFATFALHGCKANPEEIKENKPVSTTEMTQAETETVDTQPTETLDPNGSYIVGGAVDSDWNDEDSTEEESDEDDATKATDPAETKPQETKPQETKPQGEAPRELTEYEKYMAMSPEDQQKYYNSFPSVEAFFEWLQKAKAEYEAGLDYVEIGKGPIDIEEIINSNG